MSRYKYIVLLFVMLFSTPALAQNGDGFGFGAKVGLNLADFTSSTGESRPGLFTGAFVDYNIKRFGFELGLYYTEQGSLNVVEQSVPGNRADYMFDYVNAQLLAKYQIFNGFRIYVGPQGSLLVNSERKYRDVREKINYINKWDFGVVAGVGYTFKFGLDISASYSRGFLDTFKTDRTGFNSTFRVSVGWHF